MSAESRQNQAPDWENLSQDLHCPGCGYNLRMLTEPRCPECGRLIDWDSRLRQYQRHRPLSPRTLLHICWVALGLSLLLSAAAVPAMGPPVAAGAWTAAAAALIFAVIARYRRADKRIETKNIPTARQLWVSLALAAGMVAGSTFLYRVIASRFWDMDYKAVTASSLRGIGEALSQYSQEYGACPPTLLHMAGTPWIGPKQLYAAADPSANGRASGTYSSNDYRRPCGGWPDDGDLVIAFERCPWTIIEHKLFTDKGRCVLFGDGRVECLGEDAFRKALEADLARREVLGWPTGGLPIGSTDASIQP